MAKSPSAMLSLLPCPLCARTLIPLPTDASLTFLCKRGHQIALSELLSAQSLVLKNGLEVLLDDWRRQHAKILDLVDDARRNGYSNVAEILDRHAQSLLTRIEALRNAVPGAPASQALSVGS
jgi:hypothetical protein